VVLRGGSLMICPVWQVLPGGIPLLLPTDESGWALENEWL